MSRVLRLITQTASWSRSIVPSLAKRETKIPLWTRILSSTVVGADSRRDFCSRRNVHVPAVKICVSRRPLCACKKACSPLPSPSPNPSIDNRVSEIVPERTTSFQLGERATNWSPKPNDIRLESLFKKKKKKKKRRRKKNFAHFCFMIMHFVNWNCCSEWSNSRQ